MHLTGVHVLADTLRRLEPQNRRLAVACREGGQVHRLLDLVEMHLTATFPPQPLSAPDRPKLPRAGSRRNAGENLSI